jgi:dienelactone hydrolase
MILAIVLMNGFSGNNSVFRESDLSQRAVFRRGTLILFSCLLMNVPTQAQSLLRKDGATVAVKIYRVTSGCLPTMIVSHGFGGNEASNSSLATRVAAQGWRAIVMGHRESGGPVLRAALLSHGPRQAIIETTTTPPRHEARFADLDAAYAEATRTCRPPRLVLAGHSVGTMTTMLEAGAIVRFGRFGSIRDK